ncbi:MAG: MBOAT family O-acyltransferase [Candidatus Krumholzibacteriia bacterium]
MLFNSFIFFIFTAAVLAVYFLLRGRRARVALLIAASYFFYGYWDWRFTSLLAFVTVADFTIGLQLGRTGDPRVRKRLLLASCAVNLGLLAVFKYFNFFTASAEAAAAAFGLRLDLLHLNLILPMGISFYTFRSLSYTIDVYRRKYAPTRSLPDYALFVAFFPNLVAGPIERAGRLLPQIAGLEAPSRLQLREGLVLISLGLFKKVLIGDAAGRIVDSIFGQPELYRSPELLAAILLFTIQIYADFAGYSNIARGVGKLFGLELMKNFEQPYLSRSFSEFWRRWHISLSTWIWDYVFNPLMSALLRRIARWNLPDVQQEMRIAYPVAAMTTMLLCGLWHGAGATYLVWGGIHGLCLTGERLLVYGRRAIPMRARFRGPGDVARDLAGLATTQAVVALAWLFFRAASLAQVRYFAASILHWQGSDLAGRFAVMILVFAAVLLALDLAEYRTRSEVWLLRLRPPVTAGVCTALLIVVGLYMATTKPLPFVYFQF